MKGPKIRFLLIFTAIIACSKQEQPVPVPPEGERYLNDILTLMQKYSVNRKTINWVDFKSTTLAKVPNLKLKTIAQTYQAIQFALTELKDHHSYYNSANVRLRDNSLSCFGWYPDIFRSSIPPSIGYIRIYGLNEVDPNSAASNLFNQALQSNIKSQDKPGLKGWLVDLRGNGGGNMWPMLSGIGPILGEGIAGYFIDPDDISSSYSYKNGTAYNDGSSISTVTNPYSLINPNPKVAVLMDASASSGEAIAIAFIGRPNTKSFGATGTCGYTTAIRPFKLSDGAILGIAVAVMADRNKNKFGGQIMPDEISTSGDSAVAAAIQWLSN